MLNSSPLISVRHSKILNGAIGTQIKRWIKGVPFETVG
jgi:hypothetical protein